MKAQIQKQDYKILQYERERSGRVIIDNHKYMQLLTERLVDEELLHCVMKNVGGEGRWEMFESENMAYRNRSKSSSHSKHLHNAHRHDEKYSSGHLRLLGDGTHTKETPSDTLVHRYTPVGVKRERVGALHLHSSTDDNATSFSKPDTVLNVAYLNRPSVDPAANRTKTVAMAANTEATKLQHRSLPNVEQTYITSDDVRQSWKSNLDIRPNWGQGHRHTRHNRDVAEYQRLYLYWSYYTCWLPISTCPESERHYSRLTDCRSAAELRREDSLATFAGFCLVSAWSIQCCHLTDTAVIYIFINNCKSSIYFVLI